MIKPKENHISQIPLRRIKAFSHQRLSQLYPSAETLHYTHQSSYSEEDRKALMDSIRTIGLQNPLVLLLLSEFPEPSYMVLSGNHRLEAAKKLKMKSIPAIIKSHISYPDALLIYTESNLFQRNLSEMKPSHIAYYISADHQKMKSQGKRTDKEDNQDYIIKLPKKSGTLSYNDHISEYLACTIARHLGYNIQDCELITLNGDQEAVLIKHEYKIKQLIE